MNAKKTQNDSYLKIQLDIAWSGFGFLKSHMEMKPMLSEEGRPLVLIRHEPEPNKFSSDKTISLVDRDSLLPVQTNTVVVEGKQAGRESLYFDRAKMKAQFEVFDNETGDVSMTEIDIIERDFCPLSAFHYIMKTINEDNDELTVEGVTGVRRFALYGRLIGADRTSVPLGEFDTFKIQCSFDYTQPSTEKSGAQMGMLLGGNRDFTLWVSADDRKLPVQIRYKMLLGSMWVKASRLTCAME